MKRFVSFLLCMLPLLLNAQEEQDWEVAFQEWVTNMGVEDDYAPDMMEQLADLAANKLNINQVTREELEQLPFLTAQQVEEIMAYVYHYAPVRTLSELFMIESLDYETRRLLKHFVYVGDMPAKKSWPTLKEVMKGGRHQVLASLKVPLYERRGDKDGKNCYLGYRYRHDVRYRFSYGQRVTFGLTGAQDAGEPFLTRDNPLGYDHYAYFFQLRKMGRLEALNLGMYRVQWGMGLVMNTGFHLGKLATLQSFGRTSRGLTAHASRSVGSYLHGAAATLCVAPRLSVTAFASYRPLDATLNDDGSARTLLTDGYHRTTTELDKKNNTHQVDVGASFGWKDTWKGGLAMANVNAVYTHFDRQLVPQTENNAYRRYFLSGNDFLNVSLDYSYTNSRVAFAGETALNRAGAWAVVHSVSWRMSEQWSLMLLHRYYDKRYTARHAHSFAEGTGVQNEHGMYFGLTWQPRRSLSLQWYADYAHFPFLRYQVSAPSDAFDTMLRARVYINRWTLDGHYRFHLRQRDDENHRNLHNRYEHKARMRLAVEMPAANYKLTMQTQVDGTMLVIPYMATTSRGVMVSQQAQWQRSWLQLSAMVGWFRSDDYDSRLYQYERSLLYDFSFPVYYGHGLRYALMARADLGRHLMLTTKIGVTDYFDRAVISSGLQQIDASSMADILVQLRYKF